MISSSPKLAIHFLLNMYESKNEKEVVVLGEMVKSKPTGILIYSHEYHYQADKSYCDVEDYNE